MRFLPDSSARNERGRCRANLRASVNDCAAASLMVGTGETYLPAFALAAGLGEVTSGLVSTIPLLAGAALQLAAPMGMRWIGSYRRWVVACVLVQALSFLPLAIGAAMGFVGPGLVFLAAAAYWGAGLSSSPAWNTWMGSLVPPRIRADWFARRTRIGQACVMSGFVLAGFALEWGKSIGYSLQMFALLFLAASVSRFISCGFLAQQADAPDDTRAHRSVTLIELLGRLRHRTDGALLLYFLAVQCAVQISGPFFNPYMLQHLHLSYVQYVALVASALGGRILALPLLGRLARRFGARTLLWVGGVGIVPMSAAWVVSDEFYYLLSMQLAIGIAWAAYELAVALLFFEAIDERERASMLTKYNFAHAAATVIGSLIGGAVLAQLGKRPEIYLGLFVASSVVRLAALGLLWRVPADDALAPQPATVPLPAKPPERKAAA
ncbi:MAG TPA: MFS transporter [Pirellulales bacterium]|nr:MFS transporter [Pirellulales bacterium]